MILWIGQTLIKDVLGATEPGWMLGGVRKGGGMTWAASRPRLLLLDSLWSALNSHCPGMAMEIHQGLGRGAPKELGRSCLVLYHCCKMSEEIMAANVPNFMETLDSRSKKLNVLQGG